MSKPNPWEAEARRRKVRAIVDRIDDVCALVFGLNARIDGFAVADMLSRWGDSQWQALADSAFVHIPGTESRDEIVEEYRSRGRRAQQRSAS